MAKVVIRREKLGSFSYEYRVPGKNKTEASACYTNDKQDAIDTAKAIHGRDVEVSFRSFTR